MGNKGYFDQLVLWDGENTYWSDEMKPSCGYKDIEKMLRPNPFTDSRFFIIGDL